MYEFLEHHFMKKKLSKNGVSRSQLQKTQRKREKKLKRSPKAEKKIHFR